MLVVVATRVPYANIASKLAHLVWAQKAGNALPYIIVVQDDVDPFDMPMVLHALATKCHPVRGIHKQENSTGIALDPFLNLYERLYNLGAKAYFDCTWPVDWDPSIAVPPRASFDQIYPEAVKEKVLKNWRNYGYQD